MFRVSIIAILTVKKLYHFSITFHVFFELLFAQIFVYALSHMKSIISIFSVIVINFVEVHLNTFQIYNSCLFYHQSLLIESYSI